MKPQKSQRRGQQLRLHISGFSCLRASDLSLKNIPVRLQRLRDRKPGGIHLSLCGAEFNFPKTIYVFQHPILRKKKNFCNGKFSCVVPEVSRDFVVQLVNLCASHQHPTSFLLTTFAKRFVFRVHVNQLTRFLRPILPAHV